MNVSIKKLSSRAKPQTISSNKLVKHCSLVILTCLGRAISSPEPSCPKRATSNKKVNHFHILSFPPFSNLLDRFLEVSNRANENNQTHDHGDPPSDGPT